MIERYSICQAKKIISQRFEAGILVPYKPNYNASQGDKLPVITNTEPDRVSLFQWGLVPFDSKDAKIGDKLLNARVENIKGKKPYSDLLPIKRCIVLADGFYVWKEQHGVRTPYRVTKKDGSLFAMAGIWDEWKMDDDDEEKALFGSFSIITTQANSLIEGTTDRMPAILNREQEKDWLTEDADISIPDLLQLISPYPSEELRQYKVANLVNLPTNNSAKVIRELNSGTPGHTLSLFD